MDRYDDSHIDRNDFDPNDFNDFDDAMTPLPNENRNTDSSPWSFYSASPEQRDRPRPSRHSSLPRALFASGSGSIFGSGASNSRVEDRTADRPPLLNFTPPSTEDVNINPQPALSTLPGPSSNVEYADQIRDTIDRRRMPIRLPPSQSLPQVEKDADDPTTPPSSHPTLGRTESTTRSTLSRLFAVQAPISPSTSRQSSYQLQPRTYTRQLQHQETTALPDHLYTRGLLGGRHSDITIHAFGQAYKLHRLILDRAPFFTSALSEPWLEANATSMTVKPEEIDSSITQHSFELALKRLYGYPNVVEEDADAVGLFATGCWLEMQDLIDSSIESMLRQMMPETLSPLISLVTRNYYGRAGDKILASAKAMLCRDGWRMPLRYWDNIPGDIIREIVGGDGFFIDGEWDRWVLGKRILDRRLRARALEAGLVESSSRRRVLKAPDSVNLMAVRFDTVYRKNSMGTGRGVPDAMHKWIGLYTHPDVEPLLVLLDEGIHYIHLDFEQLQFIRRARDMLGLPVMPEKVISNALWQQMELRQKVMNAREPDLELGLSVQSVDTSVSEREAGRDTTMSITTPASPPGPKGKQKAMEQEDADEDLDSGSWDGNGKPRKFWIPSSDCNIVMGGNADPVIATSNNTTLQRHASRLSATIQPEDLQWASDFTAQTSTANPPRPRSADGLSSAPEQPPVTYSHFPPFRFAAEFPNPRLLKERKRVYSRTVFYAGSLWNIYIQKVASTRSKQLGVYLHRAKEKETEEVIAGTAGMAQGSVDERIGQLEREMILRSERRERRQRRRTTLGSDGTDGDGAEDSVGSAGDPDASLIGAAADASAGASSQPRMRDLLSRHGRTGRDGQTDIASSPSASTFPNALTPDSDDSETDTSETERLISASKKFHVPTLPPYVDARPTIRTYFKIYSPSRGGRMLSVYESAPDRFNFSQSWGWKSSTLMLDEGLLGDDEQDIKLGEVEEKDVVSSAAAKKRAGLGDGKLRFMVVIGNI